MLVHDDDRAPNGSNEPIQSRSQDKQPHVSLDSCTTDTTPATAIRSLHASIPHRSSIVGLAGDLEDAPPRCGARSTELPRATNCPSAQTSTPRVHYPLLDQLDTLYQIHTCSRTHSTGRIVRTHSISANHPQDASSSPPGISETHSGLGTVGVAVGLEVVVRRDVA